jgi:hypothetical protein
MTYVRIVTVAVALAAALPSIALAQSREPEPFAKFAADIRGVLPKYPADPDTVKALAVTKENMPTRGLGLSLGANVYPFRVGKVGIGFGAELLTTRGSNTLDTTTAGSTTTTTGPTVKTRFSAFAPNASVNFGSRKGWSYLSGGLGRAQFTTELESKPVGDATSKPKVIHYGGGARWFAQDHVAFTFDIRFYRIDPQAATTPPTPPTSTVSSRPAYGGRRLLVASAGISFK